MRAVRVDPAAGSRSVAVKELITVAGRAATVLLCHSGSSLEKPSSVIRFSWAAGNSGNQVAGRQHQSACLLRNARTLTHLQQA